MSSDTDGVRSARSSRRLRTALVAAGVAILAIASLAGTAVGASSHKASASRVTWTKGHPWTGAAGKAETVQHMMARARRTPPSVREFGRLPEVVRHPKKQNPAAPAVSSWPPGADRAGGSAPGHLRPGRAPQTTSTSFLGATLADTGAFPPDTMGAVGPTQFVVDLNGRIRSFNKTTGLADGVLNVDPDVFWASVMTPTGCNFTSDPRIRYDRLSGRWFFVMIDVPNCDGSASNRVMIAATNTSTITGGTVITKFQFDNSAVAPASAGSFADYPTLGVDSQALYIGTNVFSAVVNGPFLRTDGFVVNKASVLSGGPIVVTAFRGLATGAGAGPFTPQGVDNYDPASNEGYFIGVDNALFSQLDIRRVTNPGGVPSISSNLPLTVPTTTFPDSGGVPHLGNTLAPNGKLDALDDRLFAAHIRNGKLWTAHNIEVNSSGVASSVGNRDGVRWYELTGIRSVDGSPSIVQSGTIFDNAASNPKYYWIPSVMVSGQGHAAFGFSQAGLNNHADAATNGRLAGDTLGTTQAVQAYTTSTFAYNPPSDPGSPRRWGDYSYTSLDPLDDMTMWTIQQFTNATNSYGVQVVKLLAPPPATPSSASGSVAAGLASTSVTITGTSASGSGFYDPGADLGVTAVPFSHIAASVSGGVTVNSATYNSPTSVTLDLNTTGASAGTKDVTVTNPDGQSATGVGILTVTGAAAADLVVTKSHSGQVEIGKPFSFTISVKNNGPGAAASVDLADTLPTSMTYKSSSTAGGITCGTTPPVGSTGTVHCTMASLANGSTATVTLTVRPTTTGSIGNTASVTSTTTEGSPGNESSLDTVTVQTNAKGCTIVGTGGNDTITGTGGPDVICGMDGNDHLDGAGGADWLYGQAGGDTLIDHTGVDHLRAGPGNDSLDAADGAGTDVVDGQNGTDTCTADGGDTVRHCP